MSPTAAATATTAPAALAAAAPGTTAAATATPPAGHWEQTHAPAPGCLRWVVDVAEWHPSPQQLHLLLALLPAHEQAAVQAYVRPPDKLHALASRLLQRAAVSVTFQTPLAQVDIQRTKGRKPFHAGLTNPHWAANFNFSIAHEGRYTVLAAEPVVLVGVDVAAPQQQEQQQQQQHLDRQRQQPQHEQPHQQPQRQHAAQPVPQAPGELVTGRLAKFRSSLATSEWAMLEAAWPDAARQAAIFQRLWCLKEAFIKARGDGLGFSPLSAACFHFPSRGSSNGSSSSTDSAAMASNSSCSSSHDDSCGSRGSVSSCGAGAVLPLTSAQESPAQHKTMEVDGGGGSGGAGAEAEEDPLRCLQPVLHLGGSQGTMMPQHDRWQFQLHELPHGHVMAVARGPPSAAVDAQGVFRATFKDPQLLSCPGGLPQCLVAPAPPLQMLTVPELLRLAGAGDIVQQYQQLAAGGAH